MQGTAIPISARLKTGSYFLPHLLQAVFLRPFKPPRNVRKPMNPVNADRRKTTKLTDLPNIGKAGASDLLLLGIASPDDLIGRDPYQMYEELCCKTGHRHDPCVIDVFISITRFMGGEKAQPWWAYTSERKKALDLE